MSTKKLQPIDYTSRDFASIRKDLDNYAKRYYSNTYQDFNESSFGSLMLDTVAYVGDILSFYLDYQTNESFLDTAIEYNNVARLARQMGYKLNSSPSSYGMLTFYIEVPADTDDAGGPNLSYAPRLQQGSTFSSTGGGTYTLIEDVNFAQTTNQVVSGKVSSATGSPSSYIIRAQGRAVSGRLAFQETSVGDFERFLRVPLETANVAEVTSVIDSEGHEYLEVDHLSQNTVYKAIPNVNTATNNTVKNLLKAVPVARRFTLERTSDGNAYLQFGYGSTSELLAESVVNPSNIVLDQNGRDYVTSVNFDPTNLINTDKFGIAPANTTLRIGYRVNLREDVNTAARTITILNRPRFRFRDQGALVNSTRSTVMASVEVSNDEPFLGDISLPSSDELKQRVYGFFATQNRAVTAKDYQAICYGMPLKYGAIKRAAVLRDFDELKRNLNIYVVSENTSGKLTTANVTIKNNLKNWLLQYKIMNDTVDILDAAIVNFGINYTVSLDMNTNRFTAMAKATEALRKYLLRNQYTIGESIFMTDFYKVLHKVDGIIDVVNLEITGRIGAAYSQVSYDFNRAMSADGRYILAEKNMIFELKFPNVDIKGSVR
jgi:phage-related baseplate assembly protein